MTAQGSPSRRAWAAFLAVLVGLLAAMAPRTSAAAPRVTLKGDSAAVEVGEVLTVTMSALSDGNEELTDPTLLAPTGFSLRGPSVASQSSVTIINGRLAVQKGFSASWVLTASKPGTFSIGPGGLRIGSARTKVDSITVTVHPAGTLSHLKKRPGRLFDPFGGLFPGGPATADEEPVAPPVGADPSPTDSKLGLDAPLAPQAFLRAIVDKTEAMVGEQVTLSIYLYSLPRFFQVIDPHEATAQDFFQRVISTTEQEQRLLSIGGQSWRAQLVRRVALFPLRAGDLSTGVMAVTLTGSGFRGGGVRGGMVRESKPIVIHVTEPPADGRPTGYVVGDVGSWSLSASVEPTRVPVGGSVAVTVLLKGTGNPPGGVRLPEKKGVSWLEPEVRESVDTDRTKVSATKTLTYVVGVQIPGKIDLGEIQLPYWDPEKGAYRTARATLPTVEATGVLTPTAGPSATPTGSAAADPFGRVAGPRTSLGAWKPSSRPLTDLPGFWALLLGAPLLVVLGQGAARGVRRARAAYLDGRETAASRVVGALAEAEVAVAAGDRKRAAGAVERAVTAAVAQATGKNIRGLLREDVAKELVEKGLTPDLGEAVASLLARCDAWRFDPGAADEASPVDEARTLLKRLGKNGRAS